MTGIETICIHGWGGEAEIAGCRIEADYQPGVFEATQLVASAVGVLASMVATGLSLGMSSAGCPTLAITAQVGAGIGLLASAMLWREALASLGDLGARQIDLQTGRITTRGAVRHLAEATIDVETANLGPIPAFSRVVLRFDDGTRVRVAQGSAERVEPIVHALAHAPLFFQRRPPVRYAA